MQSRDVQHETMRIYRALVDLRADWDGQLVLCCDSGCAHSGASIAVSIAGGATLVVEADSAAIKSAMRAGYLDFVVNTLDEALRTLKNEIRQKRPLSVGLIADVGLALAEMVERGVQPDLLLVGTNQPALANESLQSLEAEGMAVRRMTDAEQRPPALAEAACARARYIETRLAAADASALREIDERLQAIFGGDPIRRRWIERVPKYLRDARTGGRWIWLSEDERNAFDARRSLDDCHQPRP